MQEIIQQLGTLFIGAIPTALLFIVLVICYQFLVQGPLTATLKERRARTEGAQEDAQKAIARAEDAGRRSTPTSCARRGARSSSCARRA